MENPTNTEIVLQYFADGERVSFDARHMVEEKHHTHVVNALQEQIAEQAKRISELEETQTFLRGQSNLHFETSSYLREQLDRASDKLCQANRERKWALVNEARMRAKLDATRERLAHTQRDLAGAHVGNARSARRIDRLQETVEQLTNDLHNAHERNNWTINEQRRTIYEDSKTHVAHFDSSKGEQPPRDLASHFRETWRTAVNVFVVDDATGEAWLVKARTGLPTSLEVRSARAFNAVLQADNATLREEQEKRDTVIARLTDANERYEQILQQRDVRIDDISQELAEYKDGREYWKQIAVARDRAFSDYAGQMQLQILGLKLGLAFERFAHAMTRVVARMQIDALRFQIKRNESFEMERKRREIEELWIIHRQQAELINLAEAQRDNASARVNAQGRELVAAREKIEALTETNAALAKHAAELRKESDWNEKRWRESATRSDAWRDKYQELAMREADVIKYRVVLRDGRLDVERIG